jgi:23S rRNA maturation-related 3'-5' exoribonuclease YhaM
VTRVPLAAGAPLFNNYGARSNEKLLLLYGFALANNEVDDVQLRLGVDDEKLGRQKLELLHAHAAHSWGVA